jgi:hypothetical protein
MFVHTIEWAHAVVHAIHRNRPGSLSNPKGLSQSNRLLFTAQQVHNCLNDYFVALEQYQWRWKHHL